jgi:hypothetical protein
LERWSLMALVFDGVGLWSFGGSHDVNAHANI